MDKMNNNDNSFMICLSKGNLKHKKKLNNLNYSIVEKHFYNIIKVFEEEGKKLLLLRNPWGFNLKNKNYKKNKKDLDFIIDDSDEYLKEKKDDLSSLEEGEFIVDFNYFCYLFEEIQIYEIKKFSFNIINNKKFKEIKIKIKIIYEEEIDYVEKQFINLDLLIIRKDNMEIYKKTNYKIYLNKLEIELLLPIEPNLSFDYYFCFLFSCNFSIKHNFDININFQSENYLDVINYKQYYDNKNLLQIIKREFPDSQFDFKRLKYKENIFD